MNVHDTASLCPYPINRRSVVRPYACFDGPNFSEGRGAEFDLWREPLEDPDIRVFVAVLDGRVVGATEYRYVEALQVAMTDFTIIGEPGLGIGRFLYKQRERDVLSMAEAAGKPLIGMFAEIYDPYRVGDFSFGGIRPMDPVVRREVLSHLGYERLDFLTFIRPGRTTGKLSAGSTSASCRCKTG